MQTVKINFCKYIEYTLWGLIHIVFGLGFLSIILFAHIIQYVCNNLNLNIQDNEFCAYLILIVVQFLYIILKCTILYIIKASTDIFKNIKFLLKRFLEEKQYRIQYLIKISVFDILMFLIGTIIYIPNFNSGNISFNIVTILFLQIISFGGILISYLFFALRGKNK